MQFRASISTIFLENSSRPYVSLQIGKMMTKLAQSNLNRAFHLLENFMPSLHVSFISRIDIDYRLAIIVSDRRYRENQLLSHSYAASKQCFYFISLAECHRTLYSFSFYSRPLLYSHVAALPVALQSPPRLFVFRSHTFNRNCET